MFDHLVALDLPWRELSSTRWTSELLLSTTRNPSHLLEHLAGAPVEVIPMPVESDDLDAAADEYALRLPASFT